MSCSPCEHSQYELHQTHHEFIFNLRRQTFGELGAHGYSPDGPIDSTFLIK